VGRGSLYERWVSWGGCCAVFFSWRSTVPGVVVVSLVCSFCFLLVYFFFFWLWVFVLSVSFLFSLRSFLGFFSYFFLPSGLVWAGGRVGKLRVGKRDTGG